MANKLWDKGYDEDARIDAFTVGRDRELDPMLPILVMGTFLFALLGGLGFVVYLF